MVMNQKRNFVYHFFRRVPHGEDEFIGSLRERRRKPERITHASIMKWAKILAPKDVLEERVYFERWEIKSEAGIFGNKITLSCQ